MKKVKLDEEEFPTNSKSSKQIVPMREEEPKRERNKDEDPLVRRRKVRKSIEGRALVKKKSFTQSIAQALVGDNTNNVGFYIINEVLLPAAKNTISEMVTSAIEMFLYGDTNERGRSKRDKGRTTVSYGSYYNRGRDRDEERHRPSYRDKFNLDDIYFRSGDEASEVLDDLGELLEDYEQVTVADFFELAGIDGASWAHNKYGWEDLRKAYCTHTRHGYKIVLPKPIALDD